MLGYVVITVEGAFVERFLNMTSSRGIFLWDIANVEPGVIRAKVRVYGFKKLRHIARKQNCRIKVEVKRGVPFLFAKLQKRKALMVGAVAFSVILYVLSSYVWFIDIQGTERVKTEQILMIARENGLEIGRTKSSFDPDEVEKAIGNMQEIAWVGIQIKGTKVIIEVAEKVLPDVVADQSIPAHLVAKQDGLVQDIIVLAGTPAVKSGDTVQKGQILISGYVYANELNAGNIEQPQASLAEPKKIRARGIVRARVWLEAEAKVPLVQQGTNKTGKYTQVMSIKLNNKEIVVRGPREITYEYYDVKMETKSIIHHPNIDIPAKIIRYTYYEEKPFSKSYTPEQAFELAVKEAVGKIDLLLPNNARRTEKQITELSSKDDPYVHLRVTIETIQDIVEPHPIP